MTIELTEKAEGEMAYTFSICGVTRTESIPAVEPEYMVTYTDGWTVLNASDSSESLTNVAKALYVYNQKANTYFP